MGLTTNEQSAILAKQVREWTAEVRRLAELIAAKGTSCALVMISGASGGYDEVAPELILEDAMRINPHGWPAGFDVALLNPSN